MTTDILDLKFLAEQDGDDFDEFYTFRYSFTCYVDFENEYEIYDWFTNRGYHGGGPTWLGVIWGLLKINLPHRIEDIEFDDCGDSVIVRCNDYELLTHLQKWTKDATENEELLLKAIEISETNGQME